MKNNEKIAMLFKKLFATWVGKNDGYYFESVSLLYKIFAELQRDNYASKQHYLKIKPAIDYIGENFLLEDRSVSELASMCGMKESYFQRLFKEKLGISPRKYIIQLKINHACELLRIERYSITQISEMCNFSSVHFFCRQFKIVCQGYVRGYYLCIGYCEPVFINIRLFSLIRKSGHHFSYALNIFNAETNRTKIGLGKESIIC